MLLHLALLEHGVHCLFRLALLPDADRVEEGLEVGVEVVLCDAEVPVEEVEELLLHEVDLVVGEAEALVAADGGVAGPVLVLWRRVVEVLCGEDEGGEEDAVDGAAHALCNGRQALLEAREVDERGHEGGDLDVRLLDERSDESLERGESRVGDGGGGGGVGR